MPGSQRSLLSHLHPTHNPQCSRVPPQGAWLVPEKPPSRPGRQVSAQDHSIMPDSADGRGYSELKMKVVPTLLAEYAVGSRAETW